MIRKYKHGLLIPNDKEIGMHQLFLRGMRQVEIARIHGLTRERVRQILKICYGVTAKDNVALANKYLMREYLRKKQRYREAVERKEQLYLKIFGCSEERATYINGSTFTIGLNKQSGPAVEYFQQKKNAENRRIQWGITLPEWWRIWQESGKYPLRGRGYGYVMARYGDSGAYETENVYICTGVDNIKDGYKFKSDEELEATHIRRVSSARLHSIHKKHYKPTHCHSGHEFTEENTYIQKKTGYWQCKECCRIRHRVFYQKKHHAQLPNIAMASAR